MHTLGVNKKRTSYRTKFEISLYNFSYKQFLLFIKEDMDKIKEDNKLKKNFLFRQDNEVENQWKLF